MTIERKFNVGDMVQIVGVYSGRRSIAYRVMRVSPKNSLVVIARPDFATQKEGFYFQPTIGQWANDYSGFLVKV